jgi:sulfiredoxin
LCPSKRRHRRVSTLCCATPPAQSETAADAPTTRGGRSDDRLIRDIPVAAIRRPLAKARANDQAKVQWLMESIAKIGLQEPIDVLEVDGQIYGFSGCHPYEAHVKLGLETIRCRVRKATQQTLKMHMM